MTSVSVSFLNDEPSNSFISVRLSPEEAVIEHSIYLGEINTEDELSYDPPPPPSADSSNRGSAVTVAALISIFSPLANQPPPIPAPPVDPVALTIPPKMVISLPAFG